MPCHPSPARLVRFVALAATVWWSSAQASAAELGRYVAVFRDGTRASESLLAAWPLEFDSVKFGNRPLFDPLNPARLVVDRESPPRLVGPYVEMANGDILLGRVVAHRLAESDRPGRFTVALEGWLRSGDSNSVEIRAESVARIVGAKEAVLPQDTLSVLLADGRKLVPRSLRWTTTGIRLLTEQGILDAPFSDVLDVILPNVDRTPAVLADSLQAAKGNSGRIYRISTREGAALTAPRGYRQTDYVSSRNRLRTRTPPKSYFVVHPAWSLDSIHVPEESISLCGIRPPDELPLSLLTAKTLAERSLLGILYPWRRNLAVRGGPLASGELQSDVGLGTHSHSAVAFELPAGSLEFSAWVGLDRSVSTGGCVECKVYLDEISGEPAWASGFLRGGEEPVKVGPLEIDGVKRLILVTDFGHENRPAGTDPLDIRDEAVWLAPTVHYDLAISKDSEWAKYQLSGASSWQVDEGAWKQINFESRWNSHVSRWEPTLRWNGSHEVKLTRKIEVAPGRDVLEFRSGGRAVKNDTDISLRVDGVTQRRIESFERAPIRRGQPPPDTLCTWWDLQSFQGREVTLEVTLSADEESPPLAWRGLALVSAISNPGAGGKALVPDVLLTELEPLESESFSDMFPPVPDGLPGRRGDPIRFLGREFTGGYGMRHDSSLSFDIEPDFKKFVAVVGCCRAWTGPLRVKIDGRVVWEKPSMRAVEPAEQISLDIPKGAQLLTIESGPEKGGYGYAAFASAGFVKGKK